MPSGDVIPAAALGSGTANSSTVLYGDGVYRTPPEGGGGGEPPTPVTSTVVTMNGVTYTYNTYTS
jgi:hypothetical protein